MKVRRALLIIKQTQYALAQKGKARNARVVRRLIEEGHGSVASYERSHDEHIQSVRQVRKELRARGIDFVESRGLNPKPRSDVDLVISIGGDGTLLSASHSVRRKNLVVLGVNSAPAFSVGFLCCCRAPTFGRKLDDLLGGRTVPIEVARLKVRIGKKNVPEPVLNDALFCHDNPAVTSRYRLKTPDGAEGQRSSGVWISTAARSTAALRSAGGEGLELTDRRFAYVVREPYAAPGSTVRFAGGILGPDEQLIIESKVADASVFIDGSHSRYKVGFGERVSFARHRSPLMLVARD